MVARFSPRGALAATATVAAALSLASTADADPSVVVYPGMEIRQDTNVCTLGFVDPAQRRQRRRQVVVRGGEAGVRGERRAKARFGFGETADFARDHGESAALLTGAGFRIDGLYGVFHGPRLLEMDIRHGGSIIDAQIARALADAPWPAELAADVAAVRTEDFDLLRADERDIDDSLDLVAIAVHP